MGSNYYGEQNYFGGNERGMMSSSSSSSSSRKGKKSSSDKPKQPQRGLGVAQLEKIRLHSEIGCTLLPSLPHNPYASNYTQVCVPFSVLVERICGFVGVWAIFHGGNVCVQEDVRLQSAHSSSFSYSSSSSPPYGYQGHHGMVVRPFCLFFPSEFVLFWWKVWILIVVSRFFGFWFWMIMIRCRIGNLWSWLSLLW